MRKLLISSLVLISLLPSVASAKMAADYEAQTQLADRWTNDQASVLNALYRVKKLTVWEDGKEVVKYYAINQNIREIGRYVNCVLQPSNCATQKQAK